MQKISLLGGFFSLILTTLLLVAAICCTTTKRGDLELMRIVCKGDRIFDRFDTRHKPNSEAIILSYRQYFIMHNFDDSKRHIQILDSCACAIADSLESWSPHEGSVSFYKSSDITNSELLCNNPNQFLRYSVINDIACNYSFLYSKGTIKAIVDEYGGDNQVKSRREITCIK